MKSIFSAFMLALLLSVAGYAGYAGMSEAAEVQKGAQEVVRAGTQTPVKGSSSYFTGTVRVDPLFPATEWIAVSGGAVTFEPGARSFWHVHPSGQQLIVVSGVGRTGVWDGEVTEVRAGDVISCPPGVKHWHGASPTSHMTHIAITGTTPDGKNVEWLEEVTDGQYNHGK